MKEKLKIELEFESKKQKQSFLKKFEECFGLEKVNGENILQISRD